MFGNGCSLDAGHEGPHRIVVHRWVKAALDEDVDADLPRLHYDQIRHLGRHHPAWAWDAELEMDPA